MLLYLIPTTIIILAIMIHKSNVAFLESIGSIKTKKRFM
jgi:hypothetical protein